MRLLRYLNGWFFAVGWGLADVDRYWSTNPRQAQSGLALVFFATFFGLLSALAKKLDKERA